MGSNNGDGGEHAAEAILDELKKTAEDQEEVEIGTIVEAIGQRGYGPLLVVPALLGISPLGAIPVIPTLLALAIATFAVQIAVGRRHMWLPEMVERRAFAAERLCDAIDKVKPTAGKLDKWFHGRLEALTSKPAVRVAALAAIVLCAAVPFLELVPFAAAVPFAAIAILGLAITVHDGALMLAGYLAAVVAAAAGTSIFMGAS